MFVRKTRYFSAAGLVIVVVIVVGVAWTSPRRAERADADSPLARAHSIEVLTEGEATWRPLHTVARTNGSGGCTLNMSASNRGPRYVGTGKAEVRTKVGWWAAFGGGSDVMVAPDRSKQWAAEVHLACNSQRRFKIPVYQVAGDGEPVRHYTYYYPSSSTFTAGGTVDIRLGDLSRFFR